VLVTQGRNNPDKNIVIIGPADKEERLTESCGQTNVVSGDNQEKMDVAVTYLEHHSQILNDED